MEWYEVLGRTLHVVVCFAIPALLLVTLGAFLFLGAVMFLAGVILQAYDTVRSSLRPGRAKPQVPAEVTGTRFEVVADEEQQTVGSGVRK